MKFDHSQFMRAAILSLPLMYAVCTTDAQARDRTPHSATSTVTRTGPAGNTSTRQTSVATNGQGGFSSASKLTGPAGNVTTRQQSGGYNAATQSFSRSGTTTYANGKQSNFNASVQATGNGYQRTATHTAPDGKSVTSQGQASYNAATGTVTQSRVTTGPNGKSATETRTIAVGTPSSH
ncbi:MAG: hypothetical protein JSS29_15745 [Proteobacteria bacterium]|nr:hypothetical protein [Pseudomonadota bacterium]